VCVYTHTHPYTRHTTRDALTSISRDRGQSHCPNAATNAITHFRALPDPSSRWMRSAICLTPPLDGCGRALKCLTPPLEGCGRALKCLIPEWLTMPKGVLASHVIVSLSLSLSVLLSLSHAHTHHATHTQPPKHKYILALRVPICDVSMNNTRSIPLELDHRSARAGEQHVRAELMYIRCNT
jgi:hypothetical protein